MKYIETMYEQIQDSDCISITESLPNRSCRIPDFIAENGQLKLAVYANQGLLTVHVIQARQLKSATCGEKCNSYVQVKLVPESDRQKNCETEVIYDTNRPVFEEKFSFEMDRGVEKKRLSISTHHKKTDGCSEFLGCMSFGIKHLLSKGKDVSGWYHLLPENIGKRKHILVQQHPYAYLGKQNIPKINKALEGMETITVAIKKSSTGYGFSVVGGCPVKVGRVDADSPAAAAGLHKGDLIVSINGKNVSRSTNDSVAKIVKNSQKQVILDINRKVVEGEDKENRAPAQRPLPKRPLRAPSTPGDVTYEQLMSPLSCPLDPPPAPRPHYHRILTEGRLLNTYIEPVSEEQSRQNSHHQCASNSHRLCQDSVSRTLCDSDMPPPPVPSRNYNMSLSSVDTQELHSVSQREYVHNVSMVTEADDTVDQFTDFSLVSERKVSGPWHSRGALDLWPSSIELEVESGEESEDDDAEYAFLEDVIDQDDSTESCDVLSTRHDFTVSFRDVPGFDQERHSALEHLVDCEARFIQDMSLGVQLFSRPLRHCIISHSEHKQLFQNIEKLVTISEYHLSQMTATLQPGSSYKPRISLLCDAYSTYISGMQKAQELLSQLIAYPEFKEFLASAAAKLPTFSIDAFLEKPTEHFRHLSDNIDALVATTPSSHEDYSEINEVARTLHKSCRKIFSSHSSCGSVVSSTGSKSSRASYKSRSSTRSRSSQRSTASSIDYEVLDIQNRLAGSKTCEDINLAVPNRHMIYNGEMMLVKGTRWVKAWCILLSDMLLLTRVEPNGQLSPLEAPLLLSDISAIETTLHPSELVLVGRGRSCSESVTLTLRATTLEQKCVWKNLVEQRVGVCKSQSDAMSCYMSDTFI